MFTMFSKGLSYSGVKKPIHHDIRVNPLPHRNAGNGALKLAFLYPFRYSSFSSDIFIGDESKNSILGKGLSRPEIESQYSIQPNEMQTILVIGKV